MGYILIYEYDEKHKLLSITHEDGTSTKYAYSQQGQIEQIVDAKGNASSYVYNEKGKITQAIDALGNKEYYEYDVLGRVTQHTSVNNLKKTFGYNAKDQLLTSSNELNEVMVFKYSPTGKLKSIKDPALRITSYVYDTYDRVVQKHNPKLFNSKTLKEIPQVESYSYNSNNTLAKIQRVDETTLTFKYDLNQNITKFIATSKEGESQELNYLYDALSNLEEARTPEHQLEILYSKRANPRIQIQNEIEVHKNYEGHNEARVKTLSFLNETTHYDYNEFHDLESMTYNQKNINFTYDKNKVLTQRAYPNSKSELLKYDENYNLLNIGDENENTAYKYNENAELIERFNEQIDETPITYDYNQRGELSQAGEESYTYSKAGNQTANEQRYNNANHLLEDSEHKYTYDLRGNLQSKTHKETQTQTLYTFNLFDQLIKVEKKDKEQNLVEELNYLYDALNRRVSKTIQKANEEALTHHYLYDEHNIVAILDKNKALLATIVHDKNIDTPLSITTHQNEARELTKAESYYYEEFDEETKAFVNKKSKQRTYYYHRDHKGSITKLTDERGIIVERFVYDAYGKIVEHKHTYETLNPYCYTGREFDGVGMYELYYYRARYYDPNIGRFISSDPIGFLAGDFNFFRYVGNSPTNWLDASGLSKCKKLVKKLNQLKGRVATKLADLNVFKKVVAKKIAKKIATLPLKAIPFFGWAMAAYDVYDAIDTGLDLANMVDELKDAENAKDKMLEKLTECKKKEKISRDGNKVLGKGRRACGDKKKHKKQKPDSDDESKRKDREKSEKNDSDHIPSKAYTHDAIDKQFKTKSKSVRKCMKKYLTKNMETIVIPNDIHIEKSKQTAPHLAGDKRAERASNLPQTSKDEAKVVKDETAKKRDVNDPCRKAIEEALKFFEEVGDDYFDKAIPMK